MINNKHGYKYGGWRGNPIWLWLTIVCMSCPLSAATWNITYPRPLTDADQRTRYPIQLLTLALDQTGVKYRLTPSEQVYPYAKAIKQLEDNRVLNVLWTMADQQKEARLRPIRIPVYKGLIGWRIFFIPEQKQQRFNGINTFENLMRLKPVQGYDWTDTKILQSNGFDVVTSNSYLGLFDLLQQQGDFFPRSVVEIWGEHLTISEDAPVSIESRLGIRYPTAMYFFVNKNNRTLANLIETGLERSIENGKFDELFMQIHQPILAKSRMSERQFFFLENPTLSEETPLLRKALWYQVGDE